MSGYVITIDGGDINKLDDCANLMLNLAAGVRPEDLTEDEVYILKVKFGEDWFDELGYYEPEYKKPCFV